jgi:hypothetical protein
MTLLWQGTFSNQRKKSNSTNASQNSNRHKYCIKFNINIGLEFSKYRYRLYVQFLNNPLIKFLLKGQRNRLNQIRMLKTHKLEQNHLQADASEEDEEPAAAKVAAAVLSSAAARPQPRRHCVCRGCSSGRLLQAQTHLAAVLIEAFARL